MKKIIIAAILICLINILSTANTFSNNQYDEFVNEFFVDVIIESNGWVIPNTNKRITIIHTANSKDVNIVIKNNLNHSTIEKKVNINKFPKLNKLLKDRTIKGQHMEEDDVFIPVCDDCIKYKVTIKINDESIIFYEFENKVADFINDIEKLSGQK